MITINSKIIKPNINSKNKIRQRVIQEEINIYNFIIYNILIILYYY